MEYIAGQLGVYSAHSVYYREPFPGSYGCAVRRGSDKGHDLGVTKPQNVNWMPPSHPNKATAGEPVIARLITQSTDSSGTGLAAGIRPLRGTSGLLPSVTTSASMSDHQVVCLTGMGNGRAHVSIDLQLSVASTSLDYALRILPVDTRPPFSLTRRTT